GGEVAPEGVEGAEVAIDGLGEHAARTTAAAALGRGHIEPEERVIDVSAAVEGEFTLPVLDEAPVTGAGTDGLKLAQRLIQAADVSGVVLGVVDLHRRGIDGGLEGVVRVGE